MRARFALREPIINGHKIQQYLLCNFFLLKYSPALERGEHLFVVDYFFWFISCVFLLCAFLRGVALYSGVCAHSKRRICNMNIRNKWKR